MVAKRVLLAAEFVRGDASLVRLLPLGQALVARGHDVMLAVPDQTITTFNAPRWSLPPPPGFVAVSYADMLMHGGYATPDALHGLMTGWREVLANARPDLLVADFAPTAMLAARVNGVATVAVGDGFSLPPSLTPMPNMRPWADVAPDAPASIEGRVLAVVNAVLRALHSREIRGLRDLFLDAPGFLCTLPELDHYPDRPGGNWYGDVIAAWHGADPVWPDGNGGRVYVELDPRHPALPRIAVALDGLGLPTLVQGAGLPARLVDAMERRTVRVTTGTDRAALLSRCDIVVCQSLEAAAPSLLAGKPLLMLPVFIEQMMTLHRVARQGLGFGVPPDADVASLDAALRRLLDDDACRLRAASFSRRYDGYRSADAVEAVAGEIHELLEHDHAERNV